MSIQKTLLFVLLYSGGNVMATTDNKLYKGAYNEVKNVLKKHPERDCHKIAKDIAASRWFMMRKTRLRLEEQAYEACFNINEAKSNPFAGSMLDKGW